VVAAARGNGVFLMEAMWSRFLPAYRVLQDLIGAGRIGVPLVVEGDFGFRMPVMPDHRLFDRALGGGALLDLGVYPVQLCNLLLGAPDRVVADGVIGETGSTSRSRPSSTTWAVASASSRRRSGCRWPAVHGSPEATGGLRCHRSCSAPTPSSSAAPRGPSASTRRLTVTGCGSRWTRSTAA